MFKNYFKIAFRNLQKYKSFSIINILGLAIGMTVCLLILHYVYFEKSYDKFYENSENIYRLRYERTSSEGTSVRFASCCPPAALVIRERYPEVEKIARIVHYRAVVSHENTKFMEEKMYFAEPDFMDIFKFKFIAGNPIYGIVEPNKAFISESTAKKYFGDQSPIGKTIYVDKKVDYEVVGIFEDIPANSHLKFDILLSFENVISMYGEEMQWWGHTGFYTYITFKPNINPHEFENKLPQLVNAEFGEALKEYKMTCELILQPLEEIHLTSHFMQEYEPNGNTDSVNFLFIIALFVIIIAWVNYINLSTARSFNRAREVGVRKVVGASKHQLMGQFFFETFLLNFIAIILSFLLVKLLLPLFSQLTHLPMQFSPWHENWFWFSIAIMFSVGVLLSGLYPVVVLSSFDPTRVLKRKIANLSSGINLRKALVVFQFVMALALITGTIVVYYQLVYMKSQNLGFDIDQILVVNTPRVRDEATFANQFQSFKQTLFKNTAIQKFCMVTEVPGRQIYWDNGGIFRAGEDISKSKNYLIVGTDYDFTDVFNIKMVAGRFFSKEFPSDKDALVLNETAVKWMGFKNVQEAVGDQVNYWGQIYNIIGVIKDYHQQSLKAAFEPNIFRFMPLGRGTRGLFAMKIAPTNIKDTVNLVDKHYNTFFSGNPFDYFFLDEYYDQQYKADELFGKVFGIFAFLAIFVTSLGILGLSSFMTIQRTKEIGIRKVLGATITGIIMLISKEFTKWVLIANVIAIPLAWYVMNLWLQNFEYHVNIGWWIFFISGILALLIALFTVATQVIRAALSNPVNALRYE